MNIKLKLELLETTAVRHVIVPEDISLYALHKVIQKMFGWKGFHLWVFTDRDGNTWALSSFDGAYKGEDMSPHDTAVVELLPEVGSKADYDYDFGDGWRHRITRLADPKKGIECSCVKTKGPDGIEDCGGPWMLSRRKNLYVPTLEDLVKRFPPEEFMPRCPAWRLNRDSENFRAPTIREILMEKPDEDLEIIANMFLLKPEQSREKIINAIASDEMKLPIIMLPFYAMGITEWHYDYFVQSAMKGSVDAEDEWLDELVAFAAVPYFDVRQIGNSKYRITASDIVRRFWRENAMSVGKARASWDEAFGYVNAAVRLYGGMSENELYGLLARRDALPDAINSSEEKLTFVMTTIGFRAMCGDSIFFLDSGAIHSKNFEDINDYRGFCKKRDAYPRWEPEDAGNFLDYGDEFFFEDTAERRACIELLTGKYGIPMEDAKLAITNLQHDLIGDFGHDDIAHSFRHQFPAIRLETIQGMIASLLKTMRLAEYNGNRECDLEAMQPQIIARQKVSRNDPCPCGSGKKFKKCCGK